MIRTVVFIFVFGLCLHAVCAADEKSIKRLSEALVALAPDVDPGEAEQLSVTAHTAERSLAKEYRMVAFPGVQNLMIHMGKRERGYCAHYARDIGERLKALRLKTLVLHWGSAYADTFIEDNALVVTARNQPFEDGILMDGWRYAPRLFWCPLKKDPDYRKRSHVVLQKSDDRTPNNPTAWEEEPLYTTWLQDYARKWQWKPAAK